MRTLILAIALIVTPSLASSQITIQMGRYGFNPTVTLNGNGLIEVEGPFGIDIINPITVPEWLIPDNITEAREIGSDELEWPDSIIDTAEITVELIGELEDIYLES